MKRNRIDPLAAPPPLPKKPVPDWVKALALAAVGALGGALCPFIEAPPIRAACLAVAAVVNAVSRSAIQPTDAGVSQ
jgi:hypothetical protein